jgi:hypothetical protein
MPVPPIDVGAARSPVPADIFPAPGQLQSWDWLGRPGRRKPGAPPLLTQRAGPKPRAFALIPIPLGTRRGPDSGSRFELGQIESMSNRNYSSAAIHEAWEKVGKQRWDGRTHGQGLGLLIVNALTAQGTLILGRLKSPSRTFEFWRDQNKIRGRLIGVGNGIVVARLNVDGLPE